MNEPHRTRTNATKEQYYARAKRFVAHFNAEHENPLEQNDSRFIDYFKKKTKSKSHSNWRQLKASLVYYFETIEYSSLRSQMLSLDVSGRETASKSLFQLTSSRKKKSVSEAELKKIGHFLIASGNRVDAPVYDKALMCIFNGSIATGLRPIEWSTAQIFEEKIDGVDLDPPILKVKNATSTNGRSFGEYRYLGLSQLSELDDNLVRLAIIFCSEPVNQHDQRVPFSVYYAALRNRFYTVIKGLFNNPKGTSRITLYSARHQFIASLKKAGYPLEEIACIVGHGNDLTASKHYGKRRNGHSNKTGLPIANKADIAKVKAKYHQLAQRQGRDLLNKQ